MSDSALYAAEAVVAFKLAGIAFVGTIIVLAVFGGLLRVVFLAGPLAAIGIGMTLLQVLLGLHYLAKADGWTKEAIGTMSWGYLGVIFIILVWWGVWAKVSE